MGEMTVNIHIIKMVHLNHKLCLRKNIYNIDQKVLSKYAKGKNQRDISATIENICGFKISNDIFVTYTLFLIHFSLTASG